MKTISNSICINTVEDGATLTVKSAMHSVGIRCTSDGKSDGSGSSAGMVALYVDGEAVPTTYLSIKSQPSGLTVLTHTQQSAIPEGGVSISWANNVDRANLEGEVVLTVSYNSYSTEFSILIVCAKDGEDGTSVKQVFKRALNQPTTPTGLNPTGWSENPPAQKTGDSEYLTSGDYVGWNKLETIDDDFSKDVITFVTTYPNEKVVIRILASCEDNYDFIYVSDLDSHIEETCEYGDVPDARKASGDGVEKYVETIVPTAGVHTLDVAYNKDSSDSYYLDCGFYQVITAGDRIWASVATIKGSTVIGSWSTPVIWNGKEGRDGQDGERGKTGRFYYYADTFDKDNNTDTYSATDSEAPFFFYNNNYWVWKGDNFTDKTMKWLYDNKGGYPSSNNSNYDMMSSQFKYLITEAIFGSYAHFGSAIINGDWLLSQHGTINGVASTNYRAFDPSHPNDNTGSNFIPNYCVDLLYGKTYQNDAVIRGTIMADNLYHGVCFMSVQGNNNSVFFCNTEVRDGEGELIRPSFYTYNEAWSDSSWYINHLFEEGKYYTAEEIRSISNNDINEGNGGFTECSGYCDTVYVLPTVDNRYPKVFLPRPEDVQGKCVDVFAFQYGTGSPETFYVSCCNLVKGMTGLIYYDSKWKAEQSTPEQIGCKTNVCMRFMSTKVVETSGSVSTDVWYWLAAPFYKAS